MGWLEHSARWRISLDQSACAVQTHEFPRPALRYSREPLHCDWVLTLASAYSKFRIALFHPCFIVGHTARIRFGQRCESTPVHEAGEGARTIIAR
jgi:hypothetical protein